MNERDSRARLFYDRTAPVQDALFRLTAWLDGVDSDRERGRLVSQLNLTPGQRVLEVGPGTGRNLPLMSKQLGRGGRILAVDISRGMLVQCLQRLDGLCCPADLIAGNATHLPLADGAVDAALHFGGINRFGDRAAAVREIMRVTRPGGTIVISDKCFRSQGVRSWRRRLLTRLFPGLAAGPPLDAVPLPDGRIELGRFWNDMAYIMRFANPGPT